MQIKQLTERGVWRNETIISKFIMNTKGICTITKIKIWKYHKPQKDSNMDENSSDRDVSKLENLRLNLYFPYWFSVDHVRFLSTNLVPRVSHLWETLGTRFLVYWIILYEVLSVLFWKAIVSFYERLCWPWCAKNIHDWYKKHLQLKNTNKIGKPINLNMQGFCTERMIW